MDKTIEYYNNNSRVFFESTVNVDMEEQYKMFEKYLPQGARILDLGCGSGRDSKYFLGRGYCVTAIDGSEELCRLAREYTGLDVKQMFFEDLDFKNDFNGVWACASLLHVPREHLEDVLKKVIDSLVSEGILYISFKYGDYSGERNGRTFTDLDEDMLRKLTGKIRGCEIVEMSMSEDARADRKDVWLNAVVRKKN
ncbi:MAG: class I SAM-dependent methyltransferase [Lachnospiraceae bacterium]|nr:class I SAM-dependent methyltransferase [Lachnospiraceae bacterium]